MTGNPLVAVTANTRSPPQVSNPLRIYGSSIGIYRLIMIK
jgi:hypothetical protein